jgi:hypothetical protein
MFRAYRAIIRPYFKNSFNYVHYILGSQIFYIHAIVVTMLYDIIYSKVKTDLSRIFIV